MKTLIPALLLISASAHAQYMYDKCDKVVARSAEETYKTNVPGCEGSAVIVGDVDVDVIRAKVASTPECPIQVLDITILGQGNTCTIVETKLVSSDTAN